MSPEENLRSDITFFCDWNFPCKMFQALIKMGFRIECLHHHIPQNASDDLVIQFVASSGWVLVTGDDAIRRKHIPALVEHKPIVIFFSPSVSQMRIEEKKAWLIENWPKVAKEAGTLIQGEMMGVSKSLAFRRYPPPKLKQPRQG